MIVVLKKILNAVWLHPTEKDLNDLLNVSFFLLLLLFLQITFKLF